MAPFLCSSACIKFQQYKLDGALAVCSDNKFRLYVLIKSLDSMNSPIISVLWFLSIYRVRGLYREYEQ